MAKKNVVIGTTGWYEELESAKKIAKEAEIGLLVSPNFSLGVNLFFGILEEATKRIAPHNEYEVGGVEAHHRKKVDAPSGTALEMTKIIDKYFPREEKFQFASVRTGSIPGEHEVIFDSPFDTITLKHTARSREGFAKGALIAAEWLHGKKGFFSFKDIFR